MKANRATRKGDAAENTTRSAAENATNAQASLFAGVDQGYEPGSEAMVVGVSTGTSGSAGLDAGAASQVDDQASIPNVDVPRRQPLSRKGLFAIVLLACSLLTVSVMAIQRISSSFARTSSDDNKTSRDWPAAASTEPRRLDLSVALSPPGAGVVGTQMTGMVGTAGPTNSPDPASAYRIPELAPTEEEMARPIRVRRTDASSHGGSGTRSVLPEDAPVLLVSTRPSAVPPTGAGSPASPSNAGPTEPEPAAIDPMEATARNLQAYQRQLQGLLDDLTRSSDLARGSSAPSHAPVSDGLGFPTVPTAAHGAALPAPAIGGSLTTHQAAGASLLGGQLPRSTTPKALASMIGNRSLTLPKGTAFTCALKTRIVTASSGLVGCMVQRHVYGDDGRVLLIERGSHLDGEYRVTAVRPGTVRIPVLWTRVRTPHGVVVDLDSPATGQLGESGIDGHVDNRWGERLGAALLLSLIDDSVKLIIENQSRRHDGEASTVILPSTTSGTSKLAEKVLDSTINIPPLVYQNQGAIVGIYVARDVDFSGVYALEPSAP